MSVEVTADVKRDSHSRLADRLVLLELADEAGRDGWALIRVKTIAEHTLLGTSTVLKSLAALEGAGEIERYSGKHRGGASVYRVLLGRPAGEELPERLLRLRGRYPGSRHPVSRIGTPGIQDLDTPVDSKESCPGTSPGGAKRDELFEAVCKAVHKDWKTLTRSERGKLNRAVGELKAVGATPAEVKARAGRYPKDWVLTEMALVNHWSRLAPPSEPEGHRCPPHRWIDMDQGRWCAGCKQWEAA